MKIGIITLNGYFNYGNRLQNYALSKFLESLSDEVSVETIWCTNDTSLISSDFKASSFIRKYLFNKRGFRDWINKREYLREGIRQFNIKRFSDQYIKKRVVTDINYVADEYDYFVAGSDQVWNPHWVDGYVEYMEFATKNKRIAYAASFGVSNIPKEKQSKVKICLEGMAHISVRESAGADIVRGLLGREVPVVVDPTLLIPREEWEELSTKPYWLSNYSYVFAFFLNGMSESLRCTINNIAKENNMKVIDILDKSKEDSFVTSPEEFIYLIKNASLVFTDSFHATVFSIIMKTPFVNYARTDMNMNSRIDTLLTLFNMKNRRAIEKNLDIDLFNMDFSNIEIILNREREKSRKYLLAALNLNNN